MTALREEVVRAARAAADRGLNRGTAGNVSARAEGGMLVTPSAVPADRLEPEGLVFLELDGTVRQAPGGGEPSTEWRLHRRVYRDRPEIGAVLHAHPPFSTALACLRREIPALHYLAAAAGGDAIPCAPYAPFGTEELAEEVSATLEARTACLMANHGIVAVESSPSAALEAASRVEWLAEVYWRALQAGEPTPLSREELAEARERLTGYGAG